jgi:integrase
MARVKDLWFSEVPVKDAEGKTVRDAQGRPVTEKKKTKKHPDNGGSKDAKRWLACWDGTDGKEKTRAFEKKAAAEKYATSMEADALRGIRYADPKLGAITVREYGETKFMPAMLHLRPNSADTYASHLKNHVYPALGARRIGTVTRTDVQSFVTAVSAKLAPSTTETVYAVLRAMMQAAVDDDPQVIPVNPCTRINLPKVTRRVVEPLSPAAVMALHRVISPRYRVAVALGAGLGLREGEAFGLTVPRVDFLRRKVQVLTQAQRGQFGADLKTDASARTIPADDWSCSRSPRTCSATGPASARSSSRTGSGRSPGGTRSATPGATQSGTPAPAARIQPSSARTASARRRGAPTPPTAWRRGPASTIMPTSALCRPGRAGPWQRDCAPVLCRHNQRDSRNARSVSGGW